MRKYLMSAMLAAFVAVGVAGSAQADHWRNDRWHHGRYHPHWRYGEVFVGTYPAYTYYPRPYYYPPAAPYYYAPAPVVYAPPPAVGFGLTVHR